MQCQVVFAEWIKVNFRYLYVAQQDCTFWFWDALQLAFHWQKNDATVEEESACIIIYTTVTRVLLSNFFFQKSTRPMQSHAIFLLKRKKRHCFGFSLFGACITYTIRDYSSWIWECSAVQRSTSSRSWSCIAANLDGSVGGSRFVTRVLPVSVVILVPESGWRVHHVFATAFASAIRCCYWYWYWYLCAI